MLKVELMRGVRRESVFPYLSHSAHQSVGEAVLANHVKVVEYLLKQQGIEAHLYYLNSHRENALHLASGLYNPQIFRLLVLHFPEGRYHLDHNQHTPLMRIILSSSASPGRYESARIILSQGHVWDHSQCQGMQENVLRAAIQLRDVDMCRLLIDVGSVDQLLAVTRGSDRRIGLKNGNSENQKSISPMLELLAQSVDIASMTVRDH